LSLATFTSLVYCFWVKPAQSAVFERSFTWMGSILTLKN
jgi:hypothetical protein